MHLLDSVEIKQGIGSALRKIRYREGLKVLDFAQSLGLGEGELYEIELGQKFLDTKTLCILFYQKRTNPREFFSFLSKFYPNTPLDEEFLKELQDCSYEVKESFSNILMNDVFFDIDLNPTLGWEVQDEERYIKDYDKDRDKWW